MLTRGSPRRSPPAARLLAVLPFFYGWLVALLVVLAALLVSPVQVYCTGVVLDAMESDLGLSRVRISSLYAAFDGFGEDARAQAWLEATLTPALLHDLPAVSAKAARIVSRRPPARQPVGRSANGRAPSTHGCARRWRSASLGWPCSIGALRPSD